MRSQTAKPKKQHPRPEGDVRSRFAPRTTRVPQFRERARASLSRMKPDAAPSKIVIETDYYNTKPDRMTYKYNPKPRSLDT